MRLVQKFRVLNWKTTFIILNETYKIIEVLKFCIWLRNFLNLFEIFMLFKFYPAFQCVKISINLNKLWRSYRQNHIITETKKKRSENIPIPIKIKYMKAKTYTCHRSYGAYEFKQSKSKRTCMKRHVRNAWL